MADNKLTNEISIDKYDLEKNWFERIAPRYLDVDNLNHLKVGLYGYINEVMATSIRYATAHRNFLYDEAFLNTASLTKSIYNKAKSYNYEIPMAKAASMNVTFTLTQRDIMTYGTKILEGNSYSYYLTLSSDDKYFCGKIPFIIEDDIIIKASRLVDGTYSYTAQYARFNITNTDKYKVKDNKGLFSGLANPYIPIWVNRATTTNNTDMITIQYTIYQASKSTKVFENFSSDLSDNLYFNQEFTNNLANFTVRYKTQTLDKYLNAYFNDTITPNEDYYCYYSFTNNELTIFFSGLPGNFKPVINSELHLDIYTTLGSAGNFKYSGEISHVFSNDTLNRFIKDYTVLKLTDPSGGTNMPTRGDVKQALIYEFLTRDNLITEFDLNTYFNNIVNDQIINSSKVLFVKKRDDILKRLYAGYALLRDQTGLIIPTNTINLECKHFNFNEEFYIPSGSLVKFFNEEYYVYDDEILKDEKNLEIITIGKNKYVKPSSIVNADISKLEKYNREVYNLLDDEISLNDNDFHYYEGVPTYFRDDEYHFMEVKGKVANDLENLLYSDNIKKYILYKDIDEESKNYKLPSHIRFRNHYLRFAKSNDANYSDDFKLDNSIKSSLTDFEFSNFTDNTMVSIRLTNDVAENLEIKIKELVDKNPDKYRPLFIIYTFKENKNEIVSYNKDDYLDEYINANVAEKYGFDYKIGDTFQIKKEEKHLPEKVLDIKKGEEVPAKTDYIKLKDSSFRNELGITKENADILNVTKYDDGYFYISIPFKSFIQDERFFTIIEDGKTLEQLLEFHYYESDELLLTFNEDLKLFLNAYNFEEISVYNFNSYREPDTNILKNYIISNSPNSNGVGFGGQYYRKYEDLLDATYITKKLYFWFKDSEFKDLINSIGGYKTSDGSQDEVYISYDYEPTRVFLRYREDYDTNYWKLEGKNNLKDVAFRDREDVFFTDKTTNCITMNSIAFIEKNEVDYENDYTVYTYSSIDKETGELVTKEYYMYDKTDSQMFNAIGGDLRKLVYFNNNELVKYIEVTPYVEDLRTNGLINYDPSYIYEFSDGKKYVAYDENFQKYRNTYRSNSSDLFGSFNWFIEYNTYVEETLNSIHEERENAIDYDDRFLIQEENIVNLTITNDDGTITESKYIVYKDYYEEYISEFNEETKERNYSLFYTVNLEEDPNKPNYDFTYNNIVFKDENGEVTVRDRYSNWFKFYTNLYDVFDDVAVTDKRELIIEAGSKVLCFDSSASNHEMFNFYNGNGYILGNDFALISRESKEDDIIYRIPYALYYVKEPYPRLLTIQNTLDRDLYFNYSEVNGNISSEFVLNNINIKRSSITYDRLISDNTVPSKSKENVNERITVLSNGFIESTIKMEYDSESGELLSDYVVDGIAKPKYTYKVINDINKYFLTFKLNTTLFSNIRTTMLDIRSYETGITTFHFENDAHYYNYCKEKNILIARCLLKDTDGNYIGYFDFENEDYSNLEFNYTFTTDNKLNNNRLNLVNCIRNIDPNHGKVGEILDSIYIPEKVILELCFLVKILKDREGKPYYSDSSCLSYPLNMIDDLKDPNSNSDLYSCAVKMEANTPFYFFKVISDVVNPVLDIEKMKDAITIKELPVVGKHYLYNYVVFKDFFNTFNVYYDILKDGFDKLENNTNVSLKFYNTYGPSRYFQNKNGGNINTNINMKLSIALVDTYTQDLDFKIKNFILEFVENVNNSASNTFAISNLIRELEKNFEDISYIEFEELNGQKIKSDGNQIIVYNYPSIKDMTKEQLINYVPEYLNVHVYKEAYIQGSENFQVGITITYK